MSRLDDIQQIAKDLDKFAAGTPEYAQDPFFEAAADALLDLVQIAREVEKLRVTALALAEEAAARYADTDKISDFTFQVCHENTAAALQAILSGLENS